MAKSKANRPKARLPKGFADRSAADIRRTNHMVDTVRTVYERWGFEPVETPFVEYADALGKFLPDADRPNEGVFAFQDDDGGWLSLRYDLTAPLARYVAENFDRVPRPYKSYRAGWVFRNEKPGPGRFRQFMQLDADIVGAASPAADAEICMMASDTMEALGFWRGEFAIKVNSRTVLDAALDAIGLAGEDHGQTRLAVLRSIDKADKFTREDVQRLLGEGREDESGDFTKGAGLSAEQAEAILSIFYPLVGPGAGTNMFDPMDDDETIIAAQDGAPDYRRTDSDTLWHVRRQLEDISADVAALDDLTAMSDIYRAAGYGTKRIQIDFSVVRGLEYYTGAVFEAALTFETKDASGKSVRFGSVGGGGRYDGLVGRFISQNVPATGFSVGVSRLAAALEVRSDSEPTPGPVIITVMDRDNLPAYQKMTAALRAELNKGGATVPVEMYVGDAGMKAQLKYADRRNAPCVIIQGSQEREAGKVQIKDLAAGKRAAQEIDSREEWVAARPAQVEVEETTEAIVAAVRNILL